VYSNAAQAAGLFKLRALICYYGQHYHAFVLRPELGAWFAYDDATVTQVGPWDRVKTKCAAGRIQPSVLFFTAVGADAC
jgi:ubiquitin C-terminal hydrolase